MSNPAAGKPEIETLRARLGEVYDLRSAQALLSWDQEVYMPPKAAAGRGRQLATLSALAHRQFTSPEMGRCIDACEPLGGLSPCERALVSEARYDYERARKIPEAFVERFAEEQSRAYQAWIGARAEADFAAFLPHLDSLVALSREKAEYLGYTQSPYDALLEEFERGATTAQLTALFSELAPRQSAIIRRLLEKGQAQPPQWPDQPWDEAAQWAVSLRILEDMGYDLEAGRQDKAVHPFTTNFGIKDVRVTTRVYADNPFSCLFGSMHEGGHALYEQGFRLEDERTPLAESPSLGIHESQSRLWENLIGRSAPFWDAYTPLLAQHFPEHLKDRTPRDVFLAVNQVAPSLVRVEADEFTYNLHIIIRFEIETAMIEGRLSPACVPEMWNAKVKEYLGLDVPDDAQGCLQDIHWSHGAFGYFPTYALGNLYAAQLFEQILRDLPALWQNVREGDFRPLLGWLRANIHCHGRRKNATLLIEAAAGAPPSSEPFLRYLEQKARMLSS